MDEIQKLFVEGQRNHNRKIRRGILEGDTTKIKLPSYEYAHSEDLEFILREAIALGWAEDKVQVKRYQMNVGKYVFYIEPYEEDCKCPSLLKYEDYAPMITALDAPPAAV